MRGPCKCPVTVMNITIPRFLMAVLLGAALTVPLAIAPAALRAEDKNARTYHDKKHNDDHEWNDHEDQAYKIYSTQKHRPTTEFGALNANDQQSYWNWRHEHSDSLLKIEIR
jgi:hypothetical protein